MALDETSRQEGGKDHNGRESEPLKESAASDSFQEHDLEIVFLNGYRIPHASMFSINSAEEEQSNGQK